MKRHTRKHAMNAALQAKERELFQYRLRIACDLLLGKGYFELFPARCLRRMFALRYPAIRFLPDSQRTVTPAEILYFKETLNLQLANLQIETLTGAKMSYLRFLTEGLLLIHFVEYCAGGNFRGASSLSKAFAGLPARLRL